VILQHSTPLGEREGGLDSTSAALEPSVQCFSEMQRLEKLDLMVALPSSTLL
jgi:hypothetical protein